MTWCPCTPLVHWYLVAGQMARRRVIISYQGTDLMSFNMALYVYGRLLTRNEQRCVPG
jgi:hypothetical protein